MTMNGSIAINKNCRVQLIIHSSELANGDTDLLPHKISIGDTDIFPINMFLSPIRTVSKRGMQLFTMLLCVFMARGLAGMMSLISFEVYLPPETDVLLLIL